MISWGFAWPSAKLIVGAQHPNVIIFWRFLATAVSLLPIVLYRKESFRLSNFKVCFQVIIGGILYTAYNQFFLLGLKNGLAGAGGVLVTTMNPIFTYIFVHTIQKKLPSIREGIGLLIGLVGGCILLRIWEFNLNSLFNSGNIFFLLLTYSYLGWNMITYVAEEVKDPDKNIYKAVLYSCALVTILYILMNFLFLSSGTLSELSGDKIGITASSALFGPKATVFITVFICWAFLASISAYIIGGSRIYFAMARDGFFFQNMAKLHSKHKSPYMSLLFQCGYACLFCFVKEIESLLYLITCSTLLLATITAYTPILFEKRNYKLKFRIPGYPYTTYLYIASNFGIIATLLWNKPTEAFWGIGFTFLSIPMYYYFKIVQNTLSKTSTPLESPEVLATSLLPENEPVPIASGES